MAIVSSQGAGRIVIDVMSKINKSFVEVRHFTSYFQWFLFWFGRIFGFKLYQKVFELWPIDQTGHFNRTYKLVEFVVLFALNTFIKFSFTN